MSGTANCADCGAPISSDQVMCSSCAVKASAKPQQVETPAHLRITRSDRGFDRLPALSVPFAGREVGEVKVLESSAATSPHLWLHVADHEGGKDATVHLPVDVAWRLAEQLIHLVTNHYQLDGGGARNWLLRVNGLDVGIPILVRFGGGGGEEGSAS